MADTSLKSQAICNLVLFDFIRDSSYSVQPTRKFYYVRADVTCASLQIYLTRYIWRCVANLDVNATLLDAPITDEWLNILICLASRTRTYLPFPCIRSSGLFGFVINFQEIWCNSLGEVSADLKIHKTQQRNVKMHHNSSTLLRPPALHMDTKFIHLKTSTM
jgi:hypothetical protein